MTTSYTYDSGTRFYSTVNFYYLNCKVIHVYMDIIDVECNKIQTEPVFQTPILWQLWFVLQHDVKT